MNVLAHSAGWTIDGLVFIVGAVIVLAVTAWQEWH
jgi:uncharacterized membrane protein